jgi:hypothetical protein
MSDFCLRENGATCPEPAKCRSELLKVVARCGEQAVRDAVNAALRVLAAMEGGSDVADNLRDERLLTCEFWGTLIARFVACSSDEAAICTTIRSHIQKVGTLKGPPARIPAATAVFGRVLTHHQLADALAVDGQFGTPNDALQHVEIAEKSPVQYLRRAWEEIDLGHFVMWSTFDPTGAPPFAAIPKSADEIRARLGLDPADSGRPLILLQYALPNSHTPRLPTIAEAYAGDKWHRGFKAASDEQIGLGYGMTKPWEKVSGDGLPEVVHEPVKGSQLAERLEVVR